MQRILLVEDNEMNRDLISRRLKRRGYEVVCAEDGAKGVEAASNLQPALILMDIGLPVIDGYEATRLIKNDPKTRSVPVIGLSAHAMSGDAEKALQAGCDDYDTKPIDWPRLLQKIQTLIEKAAAAAKEPGSGSTGAVSVGGTSSVGHVLLVDDVPMHLEILSGRLSQLGYSFKSVSDGASALAALEGEPFDLLLVDIGMEHDGKPLWQALRDHSRRGDAGLLVLSPIDLIGNAAASLEDGVDEILSQPFRVEEVKHRLKRTHRLRSLEGRQDKLKRGLEGERRRTEYLMTSRLPDPLLAELRSKRRLPPRVEPVAVLSMDVPGLSRLLMEGETATVMAAFQRWATTFESVAEARKVHVLSVQGSVLTAAAGGFSGADDPVRAVVGSAWEALAQVGDMGAGLGFRCGVHAGPAHVGIIGRKNFFLGVWGEVADTAAQVRNGGIPGTLHVSADAWQRLSGAGGEEVGSVGPAGQETRIFRVSSV